MHLQEIKKLVADDFAAVDSMIITNMSSDVELITQIGSYIVSNGGKRIRPLITLLTAKACGIANEQHITLATIIEYIHTATLLHDDVIDAGTIRRNMPTANSRWGNEAAVLVGDFLYSRAFQLMMKLNSIQICNIMANATNTIAEGEVLQLQQRNKLNPNEANYLQIITFKTAELFKAATNISSLLAGNSANMVATIAQFGLNFGITYQLVDDILDYAQLTKNLGKNQGTDLANGKATLPLIYLLQHGDSKTKELIHQALTNYTADLFPQIQAAITNSNAMEYTKKAIAKYERLAKIAICELPATKYRDALVALVEFITKREK